MIYIDELFILNFIIDYILLSVTNDILKLNTTFKKKIISSLIGELLLISIFFYINKYIIVLLKLIICLLMIYISFGFKDLKNYIKECIYFNLLSFFLGGTLYYLKNENLIKYKYCLLLIPFIMNIIKYYSYDLKKIFITKYKVTIYLNNGNILNLCGYMDSGNELIEPYNNRKVIIINKEVDEKYYLVPYKTIDNSSLMKCFNPKKVYIDGIGERNDISVGIVNRKFIGYDCLLNYKLMEEK